MNSSTTKGRNILDNLQSYRLYTLIETEYAASGRTDPDFAMYASQKLGCTVTVANVSGARTDLAVPVNGAPRETAASRLAEAMRRITALEAALNNKTSIVGLSGRQA